MERGDLARFGALLSQTPAEKDLLTLHGDPLLSRAVWEGKEAFVRLMANAGWSPLKRGPGRSRNPSAIEWACGRAGGFAMALLLLDAIESGDFPEKKRRKALTRALPGAILEDRADVVQRLLALGARFSHPAEIVHACRTVALLDAVEGAYPEEWKKEMLTLAVGNGLSMEVIGVMVKRGYEWGAAVEVACQKCCPEALALFLEKDPALLVPLLESPVRVLKNVFHGLGESSLSEGEGVLQLLLEKGFNPATPKDRGGVGDEEKWLDVLFDPATSDMVSKNLLPRFFAMVDPLLAVSGQNLAQSEHVLHWLCTHGTEIEVVDWARHCLGAGVDPNVQDKSGNTPLHGLADNEDCPEEVAMAMASVLFDHGARAAIRNIPQRDAPEGRYPVGYACETGRWALAEHLCRNGLEGEGLGLAQWAIRLDRLDVLENIISKNPGYFILKDCGDEETLIQDMAYFRKPHMIPFALKVGVGVDETGGHEQVTPLEIACSQSPEFREKAINVELIEALLNGGADPFRPTLEGKDLLDLVRTWPKGKQTSAAIALIESARTRWALEKSLPPAVPAALPSRL
jgi:hypothetical protein